MALVLALEPDLRQSAILKRVIRERVHAELVVVDSRDAAVSALAARVPDVILLTALLSPRDEAELIAHLRSLSGADHVQTHTLPQLASSSAEPDAPAATGRLLGKFRRKKAAEPIPGCDPAVFADQVGSFIERAAEMQRHSAASARRAAAVEAPSVIDAAEPEPDPAQSTSSSAWSSPFEWRRPEPAIERAEAVAETREDRRPLVSATPLAVVAEEAEEKEVRRQEIEREKQAEAERARRQAAAAAAEQKRLELEAAAERKRMEAQAAAERERLRAEAEAAKRERQRLEAEAAEKERKRLAAEAVQKERQRLAAEAAEKERKRLAAEAAEKERQRLAAEAAEKERKRLAAEAAEKERKRLAVEAAEKERKRLAAEAAEKERQRLAVEAAEKERKRLEAEAAEKERQRLAADAAERERVRVAAEAAEQERLRVEAEAAKAAEDDVGDTGFADLSDAFSEFRAEADERTQSLLRLMPLAIWARREESKEPASPDVGPEVGNDDLRDMIAGLALPPHVAGVSYARGCRIRRVRVPAASAPPRTRGARPVILSRRALDELRAEQSQQGDR